MRVLNAAELQALLGPETTRWHELGLTVTTGTPGEPAAANQVTVRQGDDVVGFTAWSPEFLERREFRVVIASDRPVVPLPAGFLPWDPIRARQAKQQRWLPGGAAR
jgi:hypothetical protein